MGLPGIGDIGGGGGSSPLDKLNPGKGLQKLGKLLENADPMKLISNLAGAAKGGEE